MEKEKETIGRISVEDDVITMKECMLFFEDLKDLIISSAKGTQDAIEQMMDEKFNSYHRTYETDQADRDQDRRPRSSHTCIGRCTFVK